MLHRKQNRLAVFNKSKRFNITLDEETQCVTKNFNCIAPYIVKAFEGGGEFPLFQVHFKTGALFAKGFNKVYNAFDPAAMEKFAKAFGKAIFAGDFNFGFISDEESATYHAKGDKSYFDDCFFASTYWTLLASCVGAVIAKGDHRPVMAHLKSGE